MPAANILDGGGGADTLIGLGGNDFYYVDNAGDQVVEGAGGGNDRVFASVSYTLDAGPEVEMLSTTDNAGTAAINLTGNELANTIYGNAGANVLDGKGGNDILTGLGGADTFAFTTALGAGNVDTIVDFAHGTDKIALDDAIFTAIGGLGALNANAFVTGTAAADADDRIIYNSATGSSSTMPTAMAPAPRCSSPRCSPAGAHRQRLLGDLSLGPEHGKAKGRRIASPLFGPD